MPESEALRRLSEVHSHQAETERMKSPVVLSRQFCGFHLAIYAALALNVVLFSHLVISVYELVPVLAQRVCTEMPPSEQNLKKKVRE